MSTETKVYRNRIFLIVCGASMIAMTSVATITPAFPKIVETLGITEQAVGMLITVYTFPGFVFTPLAGIMADRLGRKKLLVPALILYGILGGSCAFAPDLNTLLILRTLHGIVSAPIMSVSGAIIGDTFSGQKRAEAMGANTTAMYLGYVIYPLIGGALAGFAWGYPFLFFFIAIPLGIIALVFLHSPEPEDKPSLKEYFKGSLHYLKGLRVLWLFSAAVITYILLYGAFLVYFSLLLGGRFDASPFTIGLFISALGIITAITSSQLGRLNKSFSAVSLIIGAFVIYAVAVAIVPLMTSLWLCILPTILFGIAHGLNLPSQRVIAVQAAPSENRAGFMSIYGTMIPLGMTIAPPLMGLAFSHTNLNATFLIAGLIALIIPAMAMIIGKNKLAVTESRY